MRVKNLMTEHMSALDHKNLSEHHLGEFSSGQLLRQARQASGLQITELASSLKVSVEKLEALESDDFSVFPDVVFMRALAASVCRSLDIDSTSVLALMPNGAQARLPLDQKGVNTNLSYKSKNKSFLFFVVGSAFFLISILFFISKKIDNNYYSEKKVSDYLSSSYVDYFREVFSLIDDNNIKVELLDYYGSEKLSNNDQKTILIKNDDEKISEAKNIISDFKEKYSDGIYFRARNSSWIEVKNIEGVVVLQRTLMAGESIEVSDNFPLFVIVGRADMTDVFVRGLPFDLMSFSRNNVARFEVN